MWIKGGKVSASSEKNNSKKFLWPVCKGNTHLLTLQHSSCTSCTSFQVTLTTYSQFSWLSVYLFAVLLLLCPIINVVVRPLGCKIQARRVVVTSVPPDFKVGSLSTNTWLTTNLAAQNDDGWSQSITAHRSRIRNGALKKFLNLAKIWALRGGFKWLYNACHFS